MTKLTLLEYLILDAEQSPHTSAEGMCSNGASPTCTENTENLTCDDDHVHEINMAGCLE